MRASLLALLFVACGPVMACAGSSVPPTGPCSVAERAAIGAEYEAALVADCSGGKGCPRFDEITATRDRRRMEWVKCSQH